MNIQATASLSYSAASTASTVSTSAGSSNVLLHPTHHQRHDAVDDIPVPNLEKGAPLFSVDPKLIDLLIEVLAAEIKTSQANVRAVATRLAIEIGRICRKSDRIQASGEIANWEQSLAQNRVKKYLEYFHLGSRAGRAELSSRLSAIAYRYIAPNQAQLGFQGRCTLLEDFLQGFYIEVIKAFRRENHLEENYQPRTRLELAEYLAFSEHYAKRRITSCYNQQLIVLRAQTFAKKLPAETCVDIEMAVEGAKGDEAEAYSRSPALQQIREQMVAEVVDPAEAVLRDRIIRELVDYLEEQDQSVCVDYLTLRLQDMAASEIDEVLGLTPRQRDYLQQRFKYHVEKFAQVSHWELVHQWLGADLERNFGLSPALWEVFVAQLNAEERKLLALKQQQLRTSGASPSDADIARQLNWTTKRVQRRWSQLVGTAWKVRNAQKAEKESK
jgi:hypothetical protein